MSTERMISNVFSALHLENLPWKVNWFLAVNHWLCNTHFVIAVIDKSLWISRHIIHLKKNKGV